MKLGYAALSLLAFTACKNVPALAQDPPPPMFPPYCNAGFIRAYNNVASCMEYPGYSASLDEENLLIAEFRNTFQGFYCIANHEGTDERINMDVNALLDQWSGILESIQNGESCPDGGEGFSMISEVVPGE